jgi:hypothetical protein
LAWNAGTSAATARQSRVGFVALTLKRALAVAEPARKLGLVILDARRNNPFKMAAAGGQTRSVGRGLARVEPSGGVLVVCAARFGARGHGRKAGAIRLWRAA